MREYPIDLRRAQDFEGVVDAFNRDVCRLHGERWHGRSGDAFEDHLYTLLGPDGDASSERIRLRFLGWEGCRGLDAAQRQMIERILVGIPHIEAVYD